MRFIFVLLAFTLSSAYAQEGTKIALIDMQQTIQSVEEGKKAKEKLQKDWEAQQKKLQSEQKKIQDEVEKLRKQAQVLDAKTRQEKEESIQQQVMQLRESEMKAQMEFQGKDREVSAPIIKKIREIVAKLSSEKGYQLVMDGNEGLVVFSSGVDNITSEVIKRYDAKK